VVIGTVLHYDSLLARLLQNPLWERMKFQAIIQWPDNMYLWEQFEGVLLAEGEEVALAFYAKHKRDMDTGAKVSWAAARPLVALVIIRARDGHSAFDSEYQNDPVSGEGAPFAHCIQFWVNRLYEWVFYGACDPSLGKHGNGRDPSAILVGGFNRETGILDCVEAQIKKRVPDRIIEDIIALQAEYGCLLWGIEAVQFQEFLRTELVKRSAARGIPVPARPLMPNSDKVLRIESLQPHVANGLIRLHPSQTTLLSQLKHFPKADHDDGPDALHMLWLLATSGLGGLPAINTRRHRNTLSWENY
jgi:predicted phage terminase large subunit-like protein